jgi:DNA anti-recombination protein RmuC
MKKTFAAVLAISMAVVWAGGCQEEQASSGDKAARLLTLENKELKERSQADIKKRDDEIKNLKAQLQAEINKREQESKGFDSRLKAELNKRDEEIKKLSAQLQDEMKKRDDEIQAISKQLDQCEQINGEKIQREVEKSCGETTKSLMDWNTELAAEVERLKAGSADVNSEK